jgi:soluble lytic murein transglycosylase-like protein
MRTAILLIMITATAMAAEVPDWILVGILRVETRSWFNADGSIHYTDKRRGRAGERSAFQITKGAFRQVARRGEQFWQVETDQAFAQRIAIRYLLYLRQRSPSWDRAIEAYNAGPGKRSRFYLRSVKGE